MFTVNQLPSYLQPLDAIEEKYLSPSAALEAEGLLALCPRHKPTPLRSMPGLAARLGLAQVHVKDEAERLGIGSFKALGGAYAVVRLFLERMSERLGREVLPVEIGTAELKALASGIVFACATDGNHGRSVAFGARLVGCRAVVFLHEGVSSARAAAIEEFGATLRIVRGSYDDAVLVAARVADENDWQIVSDTAWPGYESIPRLVAQGYSVMLREIEREVEQPPTHVFVQAGVGGLAATVAAYFLFACGERRPKIVVVEPQRAACLFASHSAGSLVDIPREAPTVMAMLECYRPSSIAWTVLGRAADAFMTVSDVEAVNAMRDFANARDGDASIVSTESGAAGLAGLLSALDSAAATAALGLGLGSRVLLFNTEGAMDAPTQTHS